MKSWGDGKGFYVMKPLFPSRESTKAPVGSEMTTGQGPDRNEPVFIVKGGGFVFPVWVFALAPDQTKAQEKTLAEDIVNVFGFEPILKIAVGQSS